MRRALCAVAVLGLLAAGCTKEEPVAAPSPSESPSPSPSPSPEPPPLAALTGEELTEPIEHPVLAVKIDNASPALPPDGIEAADIVFEEEVEGGITRFLVLFHSQDPAEVGPIRSGREADADLVPAFNAVLGISGAANSVQRMFADAAIPFFEEGEADDAFYRVDDRIAPHNLFARTEPLWAQGDDLEIPEEPVFTFDEETPTDGRPASDVKVTYSPYADAAWTWNEGKSEWTREQNGEPHVTAAGPPIRADNVVVMWVQSRQGDRTDSGGNPTVELDVVGRGRATYFRDGQQFDGRWVKESADDQIQWLSGTGDFTLRPGQTFVEILPVGDQMQVSRAEGSASDD